jgi:hypothetical protein
MMLIGLWKSPLVTWDLAKEWTGLCQTGPQNALNDVEVECKRDMLFAQGVIRILPAEGKAYLQKQKRILSRMKTPVERKMGLSQHRLSFAMIAKNPRKKENALAIEVAVIHPGLLENGVRYVKPF